MNRKSLVLFTLTALTLVGPARGVHADVACHAPEIVVTSQNGQVQVERGAYGCRTSPTASYSVTGGVRDYEIETLPPHFEISVSNTGRTLLLTSANVRADQDSVTLYRDGRLLRTIPVAELLAGRAGRVGGQSVTVRIEGLHIVISGSNGTHAASSSVAPASNSDRDRDGIDDDSDHCPDAPEDLDGFEDEDGCPDTDDNRNGVPNANEHLTEIARVHLRRVIFRR